MAAINFFNQDLSFKLPKPRKTTAWIREVINREKKRLVHLNYIFCSDKYLFEINQQYLKHETLTDIITFDNSENKGMIEGDVFISIERVKANAKTLETDFDEEIHRVLVHGVLHLAGYSDKSKQEKSVMRKKEDAYLSLRKGL
jgi:probable rRNA maturation factor